MDNNPFPPVTVPTQNQNTPKPDTSPSQLASNPVTKESAGAGKTIATIFLLFFSWPVGLILMFVWMKWPVWVKIILTIICVLSIFMVPIIATIMFVAINPQTQLQKAECMSQCETAQDVNTCVATCINPVIDDYYLEETTE